MGKAARNRGIRKLAYGVDPTRARRLARRLRRVRFGREERDRAVLAQIHLIHLHAAVNRREPERFGRKV